MFRASLCPSSGVQRPCYCIWCTALVLLDAVGSGCGALSCRSRRGVDHPSIYSVEVKERVELYISLSSWPLIGWISLNGIFWLFNNAYVLSKFVYRQMYWLPDGELNRSGEADGHTSPQAAWAYSKRAWYHQFRISYLQATHLYRAQGNATAAICRHIIICDQSERDGQHTYNVTCWRVRLTFIPPQLP